MSADVLVLPGVTAPSKTLDEQPNADAIAVLEELLAGAKSGSIRGVAVASFQRNGQCRLDWGYPDLIGHEMFAAIGDLFHEAGARRAATSAKDSD